MPTVVLIHGTGVRRPGFSALVGQVTAGLTAVRDGLRFVPFYWGDTHGARLAADGASLPPDAGVDRGTGQLSPASGADDVTAWAALFADPDAELALAAAGARHAAERPPGSVLPEQHIQERLLALAAQSGDVMAGQAADLARAASLLGADPLLGPAAEALEPDDLAVTVARSLVARVVAMALDSGDPLVPDGRGREDLVDRVAQFLGGPARGGERALRTHLLRAAGSIASRAVVRRRHALTQAAHPAAGDVLRYLSRGEPVRADLRGLVADLETPVVLIGHSLGGIIALDTLIGTPLPQVGLLVTVGSQGPFLYESGSLPSLTHPEPLPPHFPRWLNVYDRRDVLSYLGAGLFPGRVTDAAVDNGQPFPAAHSAYWTNPELYRLIAECLP